MPRRKVSRIYLLRDDGIAQRYHTKNPRKNPKRIRKRLALRIQKGLSKALIQRDEILQQRRAIVSRRSAPPAPPRRAAPSIGRRQRLFTFFRAMGTFGKLTEMRRHPPGESPSLLDDVAEDFGAPAAFYSAGVLGQVKWDGRVGLETLISRLNTALQFVGEETSGFDFRDVYPRWEYRYIVVDSNRPPENQIITEIIDSRPRRNVDE